MKRRVRTPFCPSEPTLFIGAHLDDIALSCANYLSSAPGAMALTVLAGAPEQEVCDGYNWITTGETYAPDAVRKRREEDRVAMAALAARPLWLGLYDNDYVREDPRVSDRQELIDAVSEALGECEAASVVAPLGFHHPDHVAVSNACVEVLAERAKEWYLYMDMPYGQRRRREMEQRLADLAARGFDLERLDDVPRNGETKIRTFEAYETQYRQTGGGTRAFRREIRRPERYWRARQQGSAQRSLSTRS